MSKAVVGVSLKTYFTNEQASAWCTQVAEICSRVPEIADGSVFVFIAPTFIQLKDALTAFEGTNVHVAAQDVSEFPSGAFTGEVAASELEEVGVSVVEIGHAERRRLFGENDQVVATKVSVALGHNITPLICVGEEVKFSEKEAIEEVSRQVVAALGKAPDGAVIIAYEPVWAIGAAQAADSDYVCLVTNAIRDLLRSMPGRESSKVIYGGSAGPGTLTSLASGVDGIFLGRFAHKTEAFEAVIVEAISISRELSK